MSIFFRVYGSTADTYAANAGDALYATARNATTSSSANTASVSGFVGQSLTATPEYFCRQAFVQFDTSAAPTTGTVILSIQVTAVATTGADAIEVSRVTSLTNKIAGASLSSLTQLGSLAMVGLVAATRNTISLTGTPIISATLRYVLSSQKERLNTAPTAASEATTFRLADFAGTVDDPYLDIFAGTRWDHVSIGTSVEATTTAHTLTEPAGVAAGDLLVACIASRIASTTSITLPAGWTRVGEAKNNNVLATTSALASGMMAYIIRGASAPSFTFTHPTAPAPALGRVIAYRGVDQTTPLDTGVTAVTTPTNTLAVSVTGLTTTADDDLIVALAAGGQEATWSAFGATDPATNSGTTSGSVLDPIWGQWLERAEQVTTTSNDTSLAIFDAVKQTAGVTGNLTATASLGAGHVVIAGSFKLAPSGTTYNETIAETAAAAETLVALRESKMRETEAADWRETEAGAIRITEGDFFVAPPIEASVAESASAADTVTAALAYTGAVAETAGANETVGNVALRIGATVESASAADTSTGLLIRIGAIAETAAAAETTDASIVPAAGIFDVLVVETAPVVDTTANLVVGTRVIVETASAAETIDKTLSVTGAVAETTTAADTVGGLAQRAGAIAESAAAAETAVGLLIVAATVAESAAAAETITYSVSGPAGTVYNEAALESAAAAETVGGLLLATGAVAETATAFETTTWATSFTGAIAESAAAADTVGKLLVVGGAIAESASAIESATATVVPAAAVIDVSVAETALAVETLGGLRISLAATAEAATAADTVASARTSTAATLEAATAAETIGVTVVPYPGTVYSGGIFETVAATDTIVADYVPGNVAPEPPPPLPVGPPDVGSVLTTYFPGLVAQENLVAAITVWLSEYGTVTAGDVDQIVALANILLAAPATPPPQPVTQDPYVVPVPYPAGLLRIPGSNPTPAGWTIVNDDKVVTGLTP